MNEELIVSGRNIPGVDPHLHLWHWQIPLYLFLGGLAAGLIFFASLYVIMGKEEKAPTAIKWASFITPVALVIGLGALFLDLHHKLYFWRLYTTIRLESPMSWGAWTLLLVTPLSVVWSASYLRELVPSWDWKFKWLYDFEGWVIRNRRPFAWIMIVLSVILGIYTGILLSAFNARPLWNTSILGPLFLTSGLSTGAATIMWLSKDHEEKKLFGRIDLLLITIEIFFIVHMFMGFLASSQVQQEAAALFLGGEFTVPFWTFVMILGLAVPAFLEVLEWKGYKIPAAVPAALVLFGGLMFRLIMVEAGQLTRYLY